MKYVGKILGIVVASLCFVFSTNTGFSGELPQLKQLNCSDHACLCKEDGANSPPNKKCWGWYDSHTYNILKHVGHPLKGAEIAAYVTGGPSEQNKMVRGFKLQALFATDPNERQARAVQNGDACNILCRVSGWKTLETFAAPCASGPKEIIYWEGHLRDAIALRIVAPDGAFVDNSSLWLGY